MRLPRLQRAAITFGLALTVGATGVAHAAPPNDGVETTETTPVSTPYVQADSREEAERYFDELEANGADDAPGVARAAGKKYGPCTVTPEGMHKRKSSGWKSIGFKVETSCSTKVDSITHFSKLRQKTGLVWKEVEPTTGDSSRNFGSKSLYTQTINFHCPSTSKDHYWSGSTLGEINYNGEMYFARVYAPVSQYALDCHVE